MTPRVAWIVRGTLLAIPYLALLLFGGLWLWERGWVLPFVAGAAFLALAAWGTQRWFGRKSAQAARRTARTDHVPALEDWPPLGREAWQDLQTYADGLDADAFAWEDPRAWWSLFHESVERIARKFHARSGDPLLEVPVPQMLRIVELVARDLRRAIATQVPGSHVLTVNDLRRLKAAADWLPVLTRLYRVGSFLINPAAGLAREVANYAQERVVNSSTLEVKRWLLRFLVRQTGYYAIELYSGRMAFDPELTGDAAERPASGVSSSAASTGRGTVVPDFGGSPLPVPAAGGSSVRMAVGSSAEPASAPPRILILGQVKAGKSSLINALFSEVVAVSDPLPATDRLTEYQVSLGGKTDGSQPGVPGPGGDYAVVLDSPGYDDVNMGERTWSLVRREIPRADVVLLVISATSAARASDRRMLDEIRSEFARHPERHPPVLMAALSHVDLLRPFTEWSPPYDIANPSGPKARNIREVVDTVAADLGLEPSEVIPVCLREDRVDNVTQGLIPSLVARLPEARRGACLRMFKERQAAQEWSLWRTQAENAGRILAALGRQAAAGLATEARAAADRYLLGKVRKD